MEIFYLGNKHIRKIKVLLKMVVIGYTSATLIKNGIEVIVTMKMFSLSIEEYTKNSLYMKRLRRKI